MYWISCSTMYYIATRTEDPLACEECARRGIRGKVVNVHMLGKVPLPYPAIACSLRPLGLWLRCYNIPTFVLSSPPGCFTLQHAIFCGHHFIATVPPSLLPCARGSNPHHNLARYLPPVLLRRLRHSLRYERSPLALSAGIREA